LTWWVNGGGYNLSVMNWEILGSRNDIQIRRFTLSQFTKRLFPLLVLFLFAGVHQASAQQEVSMYFGMGSATNGAATAGGCPTHQIPDPITASCVAAPTMGGVFGVIGGDVMIWPHFGINVEDSFRFAQASYLPLDALNARPSFYDFNALYQPSTGDSRIVPVIEGGIGGARVSLYLNQQACVLLNVCTSSSQVIASANHFQIHGAVGVKLYVKSSIFIKPQVDFHYAPHFNQEYGSNFSPQYTISVGYTFGR